MGYDALSEKVLEIKNLTKVFQDENGRNSVLENVNIDVSEHEFLCILGPSGCGKSTLLRCIAGFEEYEGDVLVNGKKTTKPGTDRIMVFQDFNQLFPWKTVEGNIKYPLKLGKGKSKEEISEITARVIKEVKLEGYERYYPYQLSGGMKQRVAIAKAMALKPQIILMDEPFAALDAMTRRELQNELIKISEKEECTIIFITHNIQEAIIMGTRSIVMAKGGKIVFDELNNLQKPVTPASPQYGELWERMHKALY